MERGRIDRRVERTRALLHETLMSLLLKRPYESISVADICDAANIGRSTFYLHYAGKDELMRAGLDHLRAALVERQSEATDGRGEPRLFAFSLALFEHARENRCLHPTLVGGGAVALAAVREIVGELVRDELSSADDNRGAAAVSREFAAHYVVGALMAVLTWWLDGPTNVSAEDADRMFRELTSEGVWRGLVRTD